jgi:hypothetical protein
MIHCELPSKLNTQGSDGFLTNPISSRVDDICLYHSRADCTSPYNKLKYKIIMTFINYKITKNINKFI